MRQLFLLGQEFRNRYITAQKLIKPNYDANFVKVYATDRNRTIDSGQAFLLGMFPLGTGPILRDGYNVLYAQPPLMNLSGTSYDLPGQPRSSSMFQYESIPIQHNFVDDPFGIGYKMCREMVNNLKKNEADSQDVKNMRDKWDKEGMFDRLSKITGIPKDEITMSEVQTIKTSFAVQYYNGLPIPDNIQFKDEF